MNTPEVEVMTDKSSTHVDLLAGERGALSHALVYVFVAVPFAALIVAIPFAWGWGLSRLDVVLAITFHTCTLLGVTVGLHRYFTHKSFKARRALRITLAILGSMAVQGPILHWVATHRRHHAFADREGDPHSPWAFGSSPSGLLRGMWHAYAGWLLDRNLTNQRRFAPDLLADRDIRRVDRLFGVLALVSLAAPAVIGGLLTWSWQGALTAFFWASLVRMALQQHITWSVNAICHLVGHRPFAAHDRSTNFWPLALLSFGDSWHNLHHADPTSARHGVRTGQIDVSARVIWLLERLGAAYDVRWPVQERLDRLSASPARIARRQW